MRSQIASVARRDWFPPALIALLAFVLVVSAIDPAGDYPSAPQGPGLTVDEFFNVQEGVRLVEGWKAYVLGAISLRDLYGDQKMLGNQAPPMGYHLADHPPLGRIWLGVFHNIVKAIVPPRDHPTFFVTACARVGSAAAFALTVFIVGYAATKWYGVHAGIVAAIALCFMPRVFGHAHLAALETTMNLAYLAAVLAVASRWPETFSGGRGPSWQMAAATGAFLGLALLTKIQGILIPIPVAIWALAHWRLKAIRPLVIWGLAGLLVFLIGWPWLWFDPVSHFLEYLGRTANRTELHVWYLGQRFADRDVPWHYVPVIFLITMPAALHILGLFGILSGSRPAWKEPREQVLLGAMLFPLVLFSIPGIVVYDSERLFLVSFPLWAILIGRGGAIIWKWIEEKTSRSAAIVPVILALIPLCVHQYRAAPCYLSYYAIGGLPGLNTRSLERNYWGDAITRTFLEEVTQKVPEGAKVHFAPVLHPIQLVDLMEQSPILRRHRIELLPFDPTKTDDVRYVMCFYRLADLPDVLRDENRHRLAEVRSGMDPLASLYRWDGIEPPQNEPEAARGADAGSN